MIISTWRILRSKPDDDENRREEVPDDEDEMEEKQKSSRACPRLRAAKLRDQNQTSHEEND